jgi:hypothetical protein
MHDESLCNQQPSDGHGSHTARTTLTSSLSQATTLPGLQCKFLKLSMIIYVHCQLLHTNCPEASCTHKHTDGAGTHESQAPDASSRHDHAGATATTASTADSTPVGGGRDKPTDAATRLDPDTLYPLQALDTLVVTQQRMRTPIRCQKAPLRR